MRSLLLLLVSTTLSFSWAQPVAPIAPGPEINCQSVFLPGSPRCQAQSPAPSIKPPLPATPTSSAPALAPAPVSPQPPTIAASGPVRSPAPTTRGPTDAEVSEYIANWGKPSKEAARAMIDPTDENIAALVRRLNVDKAMAAYTGQRMTELQQADPSLQTNPKSLGAQDLPSMTAMRVVLHVKPDCKACDLAIMTLQRLTSEYPTLDARVFLYGIPNEKQLILEMARIGSTLPSTIGDSRVLQQVQKTPPFAIVADIKYQKEILLTDFKDPALLKAQIIQLRQANLALPEKISKAKP